MKNKIWFAVNLTLLTAVVFFAFGEHGNAQKKDVWEYRMERIGLNESFNPDLNYYGRDGWELVTINDFPNDRYPLVVFKRKK